MNISQFISELTKFKSLIWALVVRHLSIRYRGSVLGFLWTFLNPLCLMLVYVLVFKYYIRFNEVENYTVFLFCGLLPWLWASSAINEGTTSIVSSGHLITKSMFPPQILPTVAVLTTGINFLFSLPLLFIFMVGGGVTIPATVFLLPLVVMLQAVFLLGLALILASLNVLFRDVQHIVGNALTFLFFLSPILYPAEIVPASFKPILKVNPFALLTEFYHNILLNGVLPDLTSMAIFLFYTLAIFGLGCIVFQRSREGFAEVL